MLFMRLNQTTIRADLYENTFTNLHNGVDRPPGKQVILAPSFTTGGRHYAQVLSFFPVPILLHHAYGVMGSVSARVHTIELQKRCSPASLLLLLLHLLVLADAGCSNLTFPTLCFQRPASSAYPGHPGAWSSPRRF